MILQRVAALALDRPDTSILVLAENAVQADAYLRALGPLLHGAARPVRLVFELPNRSRVQVLSAAAVVSAMVGRRYQVLAMPHYRNVEADAEEEVCRRADELWVE